MTAIWRAKRLPKQPGPAAWARLLPERKPAAPLDDAQTADVAIIGAGFAGLSAARRLTQISPQTKIALLDAGAVAEGPAGRNSGFMIDLPHDLSTESYAGDEAADDLKDTQANRDAIAFAADAASEYQMDDTVFNPCGKINAAATPAGDAHNQSYGKHLAEMNERYELLDAAEMRAVTGIDYYSSGLFTPGTAMLQPAAYVRSIADGLAAKLDLYEHSPVIEIKKERSGWTLTTPGGTLSVQKVILANNGHAESFGFFKGRLMHVFTYASMTDPLPVGSLKGKRAWAVTPSDPMGATVRRIKDNGGDRIVVRSRFTYNPSMEISDGALAAAGKTHDRKFTERFGKIPGVSMTYRWAGHLCLSLNNVPAFGELEEGLFSAVCQNGLGTTKGTLSGISAAELAAGVSSPITEFMSSLDRPKRLPPEPFTFLGANAYMRWKEFRAGRE